VLESQLKEAHRTVDRLLQSHGRADSASAANGGSDQPRAKSASPTAAAAAHHNRHRAVSVGGRTAAETEADRQSILFVADNGTEMDRQSVQFLPEGTELGDGDSQVDWGEFVESSGDAGAGVPPTAGRLHQHHQRRRASTALPTAMPPPPTAAQAAAAVTAAAVVERARLLARASALVSEYLDDFAAVAAVKAQYSAASQQLALDARRQQLQVQAERLAQMSRALAKVRPQVAAQRGGQQEY
jgi:hypothetical protein